jgi:hypothetical protein
MVFLTAHLSPSIPGPDRGRQILEADHGIDEAVGLGRVVRRPELEHELILGAKIDFLHMLTLVQIPKMQTPSVVRAEQNLRDKAVMTVLGVPHSLVTSVS